jgi:hypothetical protein
VWGENVRLEQCLQNRRSRNEESRGAISTQFDRWPLRAKTMTLQAVIFADKRWQRARPEGLAPRRTKFGIVGRGDWIGVWRGQSPFMYAMKRSAAIVWMFECRCLGFPGEASLPRARRQSG